MPEVLPDIHQLRLPLAGSPLRAVNGYLLKGDEGWVLVDCGWNMPDVLEALTAQVAEVGVQLGDIRTLVITHHHTDHYGMAGRLVEITQARMLLHRLDWVFIEDELADARQSIERFEEWIRRNGAPPEMLGEEEHWIAEMAKRFIVRRPDQQLEDRHVIRVGRHKLQVIWTPGHTIGHICLFDAERRILLSGDHILDPITPNVSLNRPHLGNPLGDYLQSLRKVAELDADLVLPAHGEPFHGLGRRVRELLQHHEERENEVLAALGHGARTAAEVAAALPWTRRRQRLADLPIHHQRMALTETIAHLEELRAGGRLRRFERADVLVYELARG